MDACPAYVSIIPCIEKEKDDKGKICLYTGGAAIAVPLPVLLILSLPMAGQREELYSLKGATLPYRYAHPVR